MPTKNPRLNVVLEPSIYHALRKIAHRERLSLSLVARDLLKESLEFYEDVYWNEAAQKRVASLNPKKALSHKNVWGK